MVCRACDSTLDLPAAPTGEVPWLPLVDRLRDSPENRATWTPTEITAPCPSCGGITTFPINTVTTTCDACGTPLVRGADAGDAPLAPGGVIPFTIGERAAEELVRKWASQSHGGRLGGATVDVTEIRREYVPYWECSAHVHCPYRGEYEYTNRDGQQQRRVFGGTIDESFTAIGRGFSHLPLDLLGRLGPVSLTYARPYDPRYLAGAIVQQDTRGLWGAWDMARAQIDAELDDTLKAAGDGETLPGETWPTWSQQQGRLVLVPLYVITCTTLGQPWTALVHGEGDAVVGNPPTTLRDKAIAWATIAALVTAAALAVWWWGLRILEALPQLIYDLCCRSRAA
ncbi:hypothetical protein [Luteitalea sp. TBR-22]|uniref:hypothetical protein n=1 Tax=Luteitalea sp. TBR-22 TaxID=2802971 RepID=UPI001EF448EF|nr:hypothetical protein [Luteitalea sp. TBR-22]